ncbi:hydroxyisourate hydrolase [Leucosporidium creatinivorum]|uniref:5-hydroxyisourate hydrolase n=1 Tax=Leucosporidium creatinivorum TaxID=106004 RepID=A0A1Y2ELL0_9BASI|nr:hydroxyisourate hydrolase [Leucosporidium creatinivorum]
MALRSPITCHVLDSMSGKPASEVRVQLQRFDGSNFAAMADGITDKDGRCPTLLEPAATVEKGIYKITFYTKQYFEQKGVSSFYPFVEIPFEVKVAEEHYHVPLLLSPYAYSTYRGS